MTVMTGNRITTMWVLTVAVLFLSSLVARAAAPSDFDQALKPFLKQNCIRCHGEKKQKGKLALHEVSFDFTKTETSGLWLEILEQLTAGPLIVL